MSRRKRKRKSNYKKIEQLSRNMNLSDEDVLKEFQKYIETEDVDPVDIRNSFDSFKNKYNIRNK